MTKMTITPIGPQGIIVPLLLASQAPDKRALSNWPHTDNVFRDAGSHA